MTKKINWDALGIGTSLACAIHCAILPIIFTAFPLFGINILHNPFFEFSMIFIAMCIGIFSLNHGKKHHGENLPIFIFIAGMLLLFLKEIFISHEIFFLIPAVILIISAHSFNFISSRKITKRIK